ncbi:hypothetical protein PV326_004604, partial [Microctonus aethiopoides]
MVAFKLARSTSDSKTLMFLYCLVYITSSLEIANKKKKQKKELWQLELNLEAIENNGSSQQSLYSQEGARDRTSCRPEYLFAIFIFHHDRFQQRSSHHRSNIFPIINKIFRPRTFTEPPNFTIDNNEAVLLRNSKIDLSKITKTNNEYNITDPSDK